MEKKYNMKVNELLFKLSDEYNMENCEFDNNIGEHILGKLIFHRVANIAYNNLLRSRDVKLGDFDRYFKMVYRQSLVDSENYEEALIYVCNIMKKSKFPFALLKGAFLISNVYEKGMRYSNDIDILISENDIDECQQLLFDNGFIQGIVKNGKIEKASRSEIILSRMNYGETIPFCKELNKRFICIDINFSLDYKPSQDEKIIREMLDNTVEINWKNTVLKTLNIRDFIVHLCMHLYKEATTIDWVKRRKDLNLYKFCDLNVLFHKYADDDLYAQLYQYIVKYGVEKECYYALFYSSKIYRSLLADEKYAELLRKIKPKDTNYLSQVIDPVNGKVYTHDMCFEEWFACDEREKHLYEFK